MPHGITQEEKRTLERELARIKVSANRVATVIANEWKDDNDKVMPVKQWLEERRLMQVFPVQERKENAKHYKIKYLRTIIALHMQGEMQRLRDKLAISDRTAKAEAQLKVKI